MVRTDMGIEPFRFGPHFHGLEKLNDVAAVTTDTAGDIRLRLIEAVRDRAMMLVTGSCGAGKSFAVARSVEAASNKFVDMDVAWLELATSVRGLALARDLFPQITGTQPTSGMQLRDLRHHMATYLGERHRVLVVDEAQHVTKEAMHLLRWLHDANQSNFGLVIVGTPMLARKLAPELVSRVTAHVHIERLADQDAPTLLGSYHPIFTTAPAELLVSLNRTQARGEFRWWAKFLLRAHHYLPQLNGVLDAASAELICEQLGKGANHD